MKIELFKEGDEWGWDEYINRNENANLAHLVGWREVIKKSYGHESIYLIAKVGDEIVGVLPLFLIKSHIFGKRLVSVPFLNYGGVCADDQDIGWQLLEHSIDVARKH